MLDRFIRFWLPVLGYVTVIAVLSAQPGFRPPASFKDADKVAHVLEYFVLGLLLARAWTASVPPRRMMLPVVLAILTGVSIGSGDEMFQRMIPNRDSSPYDLIADTVGVLIAQVVYLFSRKD